VIRRLLFALSAVAVVTVVGCASPAAPVTSVPPTGRPSSPSPSTVDKQSPFASLFRYLGHRQGVITAALYDARTKRIWAYNPRSLQYTASIVKVQIMGTALWEAQAKGGPPPPAEAALMVPMIEHSDNTSATTLLTDVGGPAAVLRFDRAAGLTSTAPHAALPAIPGTPGWPAWGLTTTTARDQVVLLSRFAYRNRLLTGANRRYGLSLMEHVEAGQNWGVSAGVAPGATVALKNGWLPFFATLPLAAAGGYQIDSVGWVRGHGRDYLLAVLTRDNPTMQYGIDTIQAISARIYAELRAG
jgi:beta-lactamase class A